MYALYSAQLDKQAHRAAGVHCCAEHQVLCTASAADSKVCIATVTLLQCPQQSLLRLCLQLRHPNVLAFKDSIETQERGMHVVYLVTEAVKPLATVLKDINLAGHHRQVARKHLICHVVMVM